jgi:subtilisin-like proprotein convertase family protein
MTVTFLDDPAAPLAGDTGFMDNPGPQTVPAPGGTTTGQETWTAPASVTGTVWTPSRFPGLVRVSTGTFGTPDYVASEMQLYFGVRHYDGPPAEGQWPDGRVDVTGVVPRYPSTVNFANSYYRYTVPADDNYTVSITGTTDNADLYVYLDDVSGPVCSSETVGDDACTVIGLVLGQEIFIEVSGFLTLAGATFTLDVTGPPPLPANSVVSTDVPKTIPTDFTAATSALTVSSGPTSLARVAVAVNITHGWVGDLTLTLISPTGTPIVLSANNGGSGDNFTDTVFMDGMGNPISGGTAPFSGSYDPDEPLSGVAGEDANGTWTLRVMNDVGEVGGTIVGWTLYYE